MNSQQAPSTNGNESASSIKGYEVGELTAKAGFTADMILDEHLDIAAAVNSQDMSRVDMALRKGMYIKTVPYYLHPVTGQIIVGGRYLFDTYEDAVNYADWSTKEYLVGDPPAHFWDLPIFSNVQRWIWRVAGAHHFSLPEKHGLHRLQRWTYDGDNVEEELTNAWPGIREASKKRGAGGVWLLYQPDDKLISIFTVMNKPDTVTVESIYDAVESLKAQSSLGELLPSSLNAKPIFDRTSPNLAIWLPVSRAAGGVEQTTPLTPVLPAVTWNKTA
ncbi:hypothetical protein B0T11DRAFT_279304 [Plectosphaerella cucumerina]|uniref:Uncharacterized protein n=1 Tax=Plectosphaerella cucumerina TaxID=40658 RepID=A0A8K0TD50_9PEZI|nr:hypothetical protein B0T11DRAFT_279304 [Plectosphaerella cucumerina]